MTNRTNNADPHYQRLAARRTVRLAILFTLFMLGIAFVLWKYSPPPDEPAQPVMLWIRTESANGEADQNVSLRAFVGDEKDRPIQGFRLVFTHATLGTLGEALTGDDGHATITCKFVEPGDYVVDVRAAPTEKRDFEVAKTGELHVTIVKPTETE